MVIVPSLLNWAKREQLGSRQSCRVSRSPGSGVIALYMGIDQVMSHEKRTCVPIAVIVR